MRIGFETNVSRPRPSSTTRGKETTRSGDKVGDK